MKRKKKMKTNTKETMVAQSILRPSESEKKKLLMLKPRKQEEEEEEGRKRADLALYIQTILIRSRSF